MKFFYLIPFSYFYDTRLRSGSLAFHVLFEWVAAVVLALLLGVKAPIESLLGVIFSYLAFICLYEIGYLVNDLFASRKEIGGRKRGPQDASGVLMFAWITSRLTVFVLATISFGKFFSPEWWSFFVALGVTFTLHNELIDSEFKTATFLWLAWFRFMAPIIFVVQETQLLGIGLAAAMVYVAFRFLGYQDGKGLLQMPGRQRPGFRLFFFLMPLTGILALWPYDNARGFLVLVLYFALVSVLGTVIGSLSSTVKGKSSM